MIDLRSAVFVASTSAFVAAAILVVGVAVRAWAYRSDPGNGSDRRRLAETVLVAVPLLLTILILVYAWRTLVD